MGYEGDRTKPAMARPYRRRSRTQRSFIDPKNCPYALPASFQTQVSRQRTIDVRPNERGKRRLPGATEPPAARRSSPRR